MRPGRARSEPLRFKATSFVPSSRPLKPLDLLLYKMEELEEMVLKVGSRSNMILCIMTM